MKNLFIPLKLTILASITFTCLIYSACQSKIVTTAIVSPNFHKNPAHRTNEIQTKTTSIKKTKKATNPQEILSTKLIVIDHQNIHFNLITFDTRKHQLIVADQANGPGSLWQDAKSANTANNGIAAINAGFFKPTGEPLGIVITDNKQRGTFNQSSLGSGLYYLTHKGPNISRSSKWKSLNKNPPSDLIQSGPMLIENFKMIKGLSNQKSRPRSFIATDGNNHWCIGHANSCTLAQLSKALNSPKTTGFKIKSALNLDGGRSSDLWISGIIEGGSKKIRPFWNKPVRNFLILKKK